MAQDEQNVEYLPEAPPPPPLPPPSLEQAMVCGLWLMDFVTPLSLLVDAAYKNQEFSQHFT